MAKRKSVLERKTLTKEERAELRQIKKKLKIKKELTAKSYLDFLQNVEKANQKLEELSKTDGFLGEDKRISSNLLPSSSVENLQKRLETVKKILDPDYVETVNAWYKDRFVKNIEEAFGDSLGAEDLSYAQIKDLIKRNPHLSFLLHYHNAKELGDNLSLFGIIEDDIAEAIREEVDYYDEIEFK